ncbi:MAG: hypothetical protein ACKVPX_08505 [Myxococcaceae bacterium]
MNDTTPRAELLFRELLLKRTPEQRFLMGVSMFDASRQVVISGIRAAMPEVTETELHAQIFLRTYGPDLPAPTVLRVLARIRQGSAVAASDTPRAER